MSRGSASPAKMEAEPPNLRYQAEPGNEYNHLGLLWHHRYYLESFAQILDFITSTYRKIQIALGTILLWSSTSVSSFAYTNTITPGKFQSDTVKLPVESIPSRQLNRTQDTVLIAGEMRKMMSGGPASVWFA